jgi:hypothetical protein
MEAKYTATQLEHLRAMRLKIDMDTKILLASERLETAQKYGSDMPGSKALAIRDALELLQDALYLKVQSESKPGVDHE